MNVLSARRLAHSLGALRNCFLRLGAMTNLGENQLDLTCQGCEVHSHREKENFETK